MNIKKYTFSLLLLAIFMVNSYAQNGVSTPLSRYGFGRLSDMTIGRSAAMGGAGLGLRAGQQINIANPASYSAVDSLTFLLDAGITLENTNYSNGKVKLNNKTGNFDYVAMQFRAFRKIGMALGFAPFSKIGYDFGETKEPITDIYGSTTPGFSYTGEGGVSKAFFGIGWNPIAGLSVGVNGEFLFGNMTHSITNSYNNTSVFSNVRQYSARISTFNTSWGLQYELPVSKLDRLTVGATFAPGHDVNNAAYRQDYLFDAASDKIEGSTTDTIQNAFQLPKSFGIGFTYNHGRKLTVSADFTLQKWSDCKYPMTYEDGNGNSVFGSKTGFLSDRKKFSVGAEYIPNIMSRNFLKRIRYRAGGFYATQYANVDKYAAGKEFGLTAGFGIPIQNQWNNLSVVNLTAQYVHVKPSVKQLLVENQFRICVGITFDERWFMKWKAD